MNPRMRDRVCLELLRAKKHLSEKFRETVQGQCTTPGACDLRPRRGSRATASVRGARGAGNPFSLLPEEADSYFTPTE